MNIDQYAESLIRYELAKVDISAAIKDNQLLDSAMLCVYKVATCEEKCRGGDHIIEALSGRGFNLGSSSLILCSIGYYDEALNLLRSLGELANILAYLTLYPDEYPNWVSSTKSERIRKYSPKKIRDKIIAKGIFEPPINDKAYSELSEISTHVTSSTAPNFHGESGRGHVGGTKQEAGEKKVVELLTYLISQLAMLSTKMTGQDNLHSQLGEQIDKFNLPN